MSPPESWRNSGGRRERYPAAQESEAAVSVGSINGVASLLPTGLGVQELQALRQRLDDLLPDPAVRQAVA
jgi:hypothetical protein